MENNCVIICDHRVKEEEAYCYECGFLVKSDAVKDYGNRCGPFCGKCGVGKDNGQSSCANPECVTVFYLQDDNNNVRKIGSRKSGSNNKKIVKVSEQNHFLDDM